MASSVLHLAFSLVDASSTADPEDSDVTYVEARRSDGVSGLLTWHVWQSDTVFVSRKVSVLHLPSIEPRVGMRVALTSLSESHGVYCIIMSFDGNLFYGLCGSQCIRK